MARTLDKHFRESWNRFWVSGRRKNDRSWNDKINILPKHEFYDWMTLAVNEKSSLRT